MTGIPRRQMSAPQRKHEPQRSLYEDIVTCWWITSPSKYSLQRAHAVHASSPRAQSAASSSSSRSWRCGPFSSSRRLSRTTQSTRSSSSRIVSRPKQATTARAMARARSTSVRAHSRAWTSCGSHSRSRPDRLSLVLDDRLFADQADCNSLRRRASRPQVGHPGREQDRSLHGAGWRSFRLTCGRRVEG